MFQNYAHDALHSSHTGWAYRTGRIPPRSRSKFNVIYTNSGKYHNTIRFRRFQTVVLLHTWIAGLNDDNFKDASKCLPERWLKPMAPHSPLLVAPFGAGRRICPGKRFVELALQLILAKVWRSISKYTKERNRNKFFLHKITKLHGDCPCWLIDFHLDRSRIRDRRRGRAWFAVWIYPGAAKSCIPRIPGPYIEGRDDLNEFIRFFIGEFLSNNEC